MSLRSLFLGVLLLPALPSLAETIPWSGNLTQKSLDTGGVFSGAQGGDEFSGSFSYMGPCPGVCEVEPMPPDETNYVFPDGAAFITSEGTSQNGTETSFNIQNDHALTADEAAFVNLLLEGTGISVDEGDVVDVWTAASEDELDLAGALLEWEIAFISLDASFFDDQSFQANPPLFSEADLALFQVTETNESEDEIFMAAGLLVEPQPQCRDGVDNDDDGLADFGADLGCIAADDDSERDPRIACDDGEDNDGDGRSDAPLDPGCNGSLWSPENPPCQDGLNNDPAQDALIDFDGGQSIHGPCEAGVCPPGVSDPDGDGVADPDPQCGEPYANEGLGNCGLGYELVLFLGALAWAHQGRRCRG